MTAQLVILVRHAEKPVPEEPDVGGVSENGIHDDESLTVRGWQRAGGLCRLFIDPPAPLATPASIIAAGVVKKDGTGSRSKRPSQTVTPLSRRLRLSIDTSHSKGEEAQAAPAILSAPSPVLVSWQHESIPTLAAAVSSDASLAARIWPDDDFDSIWLLSRSGPGTPWTFELARQALLGAPAIFALELACKPINDAFGGFGCYLVGSALERPDWRDIDVRFIMSDDEFVAEFPAVNMKAHNWEFDPKWILLTTGIAAHLSKCTSLPVDFQFQPQTHANERYNGPRHPFGLVFAKPD